MVDAYTGAHPSPQVFRVGGIGHAVIVAIEGGDQAGKHTQAYMLSRELKKRGKTFEVISFPQYETQIGKQIDKLLSGSRPPNPRVIHSLLAANRRECLEKIQQANDLYDYVILDRYIHSNEAYGAANGMDVVWLRGLEIDLPKPDRVILLDIKPDEARARKRRDRDAFERDADLALRVYKEYRNMARRKRWKRVDAVGNKKKVHAAVLEALDL